MNCSNCGKEISDDAAECPSCRTSTGSADDAGHPEPRLSALAIASIVIAGGCTAVIIWGILGMAGGVWGLLEPYGFLLAVLGLVVGIAALVRIRSRRGRLGGARLAGWAVGLSIFWVVMLPMMDFMGFGHARENMRATSCQANIKQLALACSMYANDYNQTLPVQMLPAVHNWNRRHAPSNWARAILPHSMNDKIFECPSTRRVELGEGEIGITYVANGWVLGKPTGAITKPADTILLTDGSGDERTNCFINPCRRGAGKSAKWIGFTDFGSVHAGRPGPSAVHSGGQNVAYADGHVKWLEQRVLYENSLYYGRQDQPDRSDTISYCWWNPEQL